MQKIIPVLLLGLLLQLPYSRSAAQSATPAQVVVDSAVQVAAKEHKKVLLMFHASWCIWCHRMDTSLNDPSVKDYFQRYFVITHLSVQESEKKKALENPGAEEMMEKFHGKGQGIPYWVILDSEGKMILDSRIRKEGEGPEEGDNCGCPASEAEVNFFLKVLRQTTGLTDDELEKIRIRFRRNEH